MKPKMTKQLALRLIRKNRPKNLLEASQLGLKLVHLGTGAFRTVYKIKNTDLIIKFPESESYLNIIHSRAEIRNLKKMQKCRSLRPHLPKVHYYNSKTGVIVMDYYTKYSRAKTHKPHPARTYGEANWETELIVSLIEELTGAQFSDLYFNNLRLDRHNIVKFVDIGC